MYSRKVLLLKTYRNENCIYHEDEILLAYFVKNEEGDTVAMIQCGSNLEILNTSYRELTAEELVLHNKIVVITKSIKLTSICAEHTLKVKCGDRYQVSGFTSEGIPVTIIEYISYLIPANCFILQDYLNNFKSIKHGLF